MDIGNLKGLCQQGKPMLLKKILWILLAILIPLIGVITFIIFIPWGILDEKDAYWLTVNDYYFTFPSAILAITFSLGIAFYALYKCEH
jgi:hypothetical protein